MGRKHPARHWILRVPTVLWESVPLAVKNKMVKRDYQGRQGYGTDPSRQPHTEP